MTHDELVQNIMRLWAKVEHLEAASPDKLTDVVKLRDRVAALEKLNEDRAALVTKKRASKKVERVS